MEPAMTEPSRLLTVDETLSEFQAVIEKQLGGEFFRVCGIPGTSTGGSRSIRSEARFDAILWRPIRIGGERNGCYLIYAIVFVVTCGYRHSCASVG
jgi:hypothetical protein